MYKDRLNVQFFGFCPQLGQFEEGFAVRRERISSCAHTSFSEKFQIIIYTRMLMLMLMLQCTAVMVMVMVWKLFRWTKKTRMLWKRFTHFLRHFLQTRFIRSVHVMLMMMILMTTADSRVGRTMVGARKWSRTPFWQIPFLEVIFCKKNAFYYYCCI